MLQKIPPWQTSGKNCREMQYSPEKARSFDLVPAEPARCQDFWTGMHPSEMRDFFERFFYWSLLRWPLAVVKTGEIQIDVLPDKAQSNWFANQGLQVGTAFPTDHPFDLIAPNRFTIGGRKSFDRFAALCHSCAVLHNRPLEKTSILVPGNGRPSHALRINELSRIIRYKTRQHRRAAFSGNRVAFIPHSGNVFTICY